MSLAEEDFSFGAVKAAKAGYAAIDQTRKKGQFMSKKSVTVNKVKFQSKCLLNNFYSILRSWNQVNIIYLFPRPYLLDHECWRNSYPCLPYPDRKEGLLLPSRLVIWLFEKFERFQKKSKQILSIKSTMFLKVWFFSRYSLWYVAYLQGYQGWRQEAGRWGPEVPCLVQEDLFRRLFHFRCQVRILLQDLQ